MKQYSLSLFIIFCLSCFYARGDVQASSVRADPDFIATGIDYRGVPAVKIGDTLQFGPFSLGGMIEVRNEERFNQGAFPNHNWRGFFFAAYDFNLYQSGASTGTLSTGFEHESAHPVSGLAEPTTDPYQMIYDGTYRNINLNSFLLRYSHVMRESYMLKFNCDVQLYIFSRNTPELPYTDTGWSCGISGGTEYAVPLYGPATFFVSVFDRYIFRGDKESRRDIYYSEGGVLVQKNESYPVINSVNTVSLKTGITFREGDTGAEVSFYGSVLYGNIYGFVDSRDNRFQYVIGIDLVH